MGTKHGPGELMRAKGLAAGSGDTGMGTLSPQPSWAVAMHQPGLAAMPRWWSPSLPLAGCPSPAAGAAAGRKARLCGPAQGCGLWALLCQDKQTHGAWGLQRAVHESLRPCA